MVKSTTFFVYMLFSLHLLKSYFSSANLNRDHKMPKSNSNIQKAENIEKRGNIRDFILYFFPFQNSAI